MIIPKNTEMLLFRYNNYKSYAFIDEHISVLQRNGYVWMLKLGRKSNTEKIKAIENSGGWLVLRAPKADGGNSYIAQFTEVQEKNPKSYYYPAYYKGILESSDDELFFLAESPKQWFRLVSLEPLNESDASSLVISKTGKKVDDVIGTTRTAVMFVQNSTPFEILEVK